MAIIDKRNSYNKNKNIANRQRFIERIKDQVKQSVNKRIEKDKLDDLVNGNKIKVRVKNTKEPSFNYDRNTGGNDIIVPGNKSFEPGDLIPRQKSGKGRGRPKPSLDDEGSDDFSFVLTREEYLDILFEDLELPDLIKKQLEGAKTFEYERRGFSNEGNPSSLDVLRTAKNALGRRIALKRPKGEDIKELEKQLAETKKWIDRFHSDAQQLLKLESQTKLQKAELEALKSQESDLIDQSLKLQQEIKIALSRQKSVPYFDPLDVRYRRFEKIPKPISHAVMFCIMDVSGSMGEEEKDIAKRFFLLLYLFLHKKYEKVEIRFIRHTVSAEEVDEQTFFYDPQSGGTKISPALELVDEIISASYDLSKTNVYIAQASDGDNYYDDNDTCGDIVSNSLIKKVQYFAYIEITSSRHFYSSSSWGYEERSNSSLWGKYQEISETNKIMQCRKISEKTEIFQVFKDLFKKKTKVG